MIQTDYEVKREATEQRNIVKRLQNNDRFVPKPLRFKCSHILSLFCVICARLLKGLWLFALSLAVICAKVAYRPCPCGQTLACCPLRTPPERPTAFRRLCLLSATEAGSSAQHLRKAQSSRRIKNKTPLQRSIYGVPGGSRTHGLSLRSFEKFSKSY